MKCDLLRTVILLQGHTRKMRGFQNYDRKIKTVVLSQNTDRTYSVGYTFYIDFSSQLILFMSNTISYTKYLSILNFVNSISKI